MVAGYRSGNLLKTSQLGLFKGTVARRVEERLKGVSFHRDKEGGPGAFRKAWLVFRRPA